MELYTEIANDEKIRRLYNSFETADFILIGAGAGLSAAAGLSFADEKMYAQRYPYWFERGLSSEYQMFSFRSWTKEQQWAYMASHVHRVMCEIPPLPLYQKLQELLKGKDYYIITSNVDGQFYRNGFPKDRVFEYQGSYEWLRCSKSCSEALYSFADAAKVMMAHTRREDFSVAQEYWPTCPNCGAELCFAARDTADYSENKERYDAWLEASKQGMLCVMEMGVGFNSPGVIRVPFERIVGEREKDKVKFFRITVDYPDSEDEIAYPEIPKPIAEKSLSLNMDCKPVIEQMLQYKLQY